MSALIYCPFPDADAARATARTLIDEGLAACANIGGAIESIFVWDGEVQSANEVPVLFKTHARLLPAAVARVEQLHPYEGPAVMGWICDEAGPATRDWLGTLTGA